MAVVVLVYAYTCVARVCVRKCRRLLMCVFFLISYGEEPDLYKESNTPIKYHY